MVFFMWLVQVSLIGCILTVLLYVLEKATCNKFGARWNYHLWMILIVKLMLPFDILAPIRHIIPSTSAANEFAQASVSKTIIGKVGADYATYIEKSQVDIWGKLYVIWLTGIFILILYTFYSNYKTIRTLRNREVLYNKRVDISLAKCKRHFTINKELKLYCADNISSPAIVGYFRPYIIMPKCILENVSDEELDYILLHELSHLKSRDILVHRCITILQILHWFNPVLYFAFKRIRHNSELACDYKVLTRINEEKHRDYGMTIIRILSLNGRGNLTLGLNFLESYGQIKHRIKMISNYKSKSKRGILLSISLLLILNCVVLVTAQVNYLDENMHVISDKPLQGLDLESYFTDFQNGSFVMWDMNKETYYVYNKEESLKRSPPVSTFKYVIALMALDTGVLDKNNSYEDWDGQPQRYEEWNRGHDLESAMQYSVNWYFEQLAAEIGKDSMIGYVNQLSYGNMNLAWTNQDFWNNSLEISTLEQVEVIKEFYLYHMPFHKEDIDYIKKSLILRVDDNGVYSGKTGSAIYENGSKHGKFIGYLETENNVYIVGASVDGLDAEGSRVRDIAYSILMNEVIN